MAKAKKTAAVKKASTTAKPATAKAKPVATLKAKTATPAAPKKKTAPSPRTAPKAPSKTSAAVPKKAAAAAATRSAAAKSSAPKSASSKAKTKTAASSVAKANAPKSQPVISKLAKASPRTAKPVAAKAEKSARASQKSSTTPAKAKLNGAPSSAELIRPEADIHLSNPVEVREHFFAEHRPGPPPAQPPRDVPNEYGDTKLALLVRDPEWIYAYWEINDATRAELKLPRNGHNRRMVIRLYKISGRNWPSESAHYCLDVDVSPYASNWYVKIPEVNEQWVGELGFYDEENTYIAICRSNMILTPRNTISEQVDSEWMVVEETFRRLSNLAGGVGVGGQLAGGPGSRGASETLLRQLHREVLGALRVNGGLPSSAALSSESAQKTPARTKDFWLQVHTELILYGATESDAHVTVQGQRVKLNPDGTFSLRFALPDGQQVLDVKATNSDGDLEREITPVVTRRTR